MSISSVMAIPTFRKDYSKPVSTLDAGFIDKSMYVKVRIDKFRASRTGVGTFLRSISFPPGVMKKLCFIVLSNVAISFGFLATPLRAEFAYLINFTALTVPRQLAAVRFSCLALRGCSDDRETVML
jgi:hypothetical protein